jgi:Cation transport ATPase
MGKYFFPARRGKVTDFLRRGIGLPGGEDPVIYVLGSQSAAEAFGRSVFGEDPEVLEINAHLKTHVTGEEDARGIIAVSESIRPSAISRMTRLKNIAETGRQYFGGRYDDRAINSAAERTYQDYFGRTFHIRRDLDADDKPFQLLGPSTPEIQGILPVMKVDGQKSFGRGLSWQAAEAAADRAIGDNIEMLRDLPLVKLFPPDGVHEIPRYIQEGLDGVTVEIWQVTEAHLERSRWGGWITQAGWYWQRMDIAELHGPFTDPDLAYADSVENYNEPGILHPMDRPGAGLVR